MLRDVEYEHDNRILRDDSFQIKCENYDVCCNTIPECWYECIGNYLCHECNVMFNVNDGKGVLNFSNNIICPICLEEKRGVSLPRCNHNLCIKCFQRLFYGDDSDTMPLFPFPIIEEQYKKTPYHKKWSKYKEKINEYNIELEEWKNNCIVKFRNEKNLRLCPICRK